MGVFSFFDIRRYDRLGVCKDAEMMDLRAKHIVINFNEIHKLLRERMKDVQDTMSKYANQERSGTPRFRVGERVYVCTDHIRTNRISGKLDERKIGPFIIISPPPVMSITLRCPTTNRPPPLSFDVLQLEPEDPNTFESREQPPPPLIVDGKSEYLVERIIDSEYSRTRQ